MILGAVTLKVYLDKVQKSASSVRYLLNKHKGFNTLIPQSSVFVGHCELAVNQKVMWLQDCGKCSDVLSDMFMSVWMISSFFAIRIKLRNGRFPSLDCQIIAWTVRPYCVGWEDISVIFGGPFDLHIYATDHGRVSHPQDSSQFGYSTLASLTWTYWYYL